MAAVYPEDPRPRFPVVIEPEWRTIVAASDSGVEQRRRGNLAERFNVRLAYRRLTAAQMQTLWGFFMARRGAYEAFWFYDWASLAHAGLFVAVADGVRTVFDLPGKETSGQSVYLDGTVQSAGVAYLAGGGDGGADRVSFATAPAAGALITSDFIGRLRMRVRFASDRLPREWSVATRFDLDIELKGLSPAP